MDRGIVTISDDAVMQIASYITRNCDGVAEMTAKSKKSEMSRTLKGRADTAGVYVKKTLDGVVLDVYFACCYGVDPAKLANEVEEKVRSGYDNTGIKLARVNAHINSVK